MGTVEGENWRPSHTNRSLVFLVEDVMASPTADGSMDGLQDVVLTTETMTHAAVILAVTVLLIASSVISIAIISTQDALRDVMGCYLLSLSVSDLLCGTLLTPSSIYAALAPDWAFGGDNSLLCKIETYLQVVILSTVIYTFVWIGVDRFAALHKPGRYDTEQTFTRCKCWILFTWLTSALLGCPILTSNMRSKYYVQAHVCLLDWDATPAYSMTLMVLVVAPSVVSLVYTYRYIFTSMANTDHLEDTQRTLLDTDHNYMMSFFVILSFVLSWLPWLLLRSFESVLTRALGSTETASLHFVFVWLAIGGGVWKPLIYLFMNADFRHGTQSFCSTLCCCCVRCCRRSRAGGARYDQKHRNEYRDLSRSPSRLSRRHT